jgi:predicted 3-demethylubiquinone-9 3-methyltransferase (glyoxalase superfamily)
MMQKITPFLWFDDNAEEAMNFYVSLFDNSRVVNIFHYPDEPMDIPIQDMQGKVLTGEFELDGQQFMALDGGPQFQFTPGISFLVYCRTDDEIDGLFEQLSTGGGVMMPLQQYPFAEKFAWVQDRYRLSWQLMLSSSEYTQKIVPYLMFVGEQHGKAEEAIKLYTTLFDNSSIQTIDRYGPDEGEIEGSVKHARFTLNGQQFMALESAAEHKFTFTEAISLFVNCENQEEVDRLWENLSFYPEAEQCGWLKDKFGVSWQIVPSEYMDMMKGPDPARSKRVMDAMLQMKKFELDILRQVYEGEVSRE